MPGSLIRSLTVSMKTKSFGHATDSGYKTRRVQRNELSGVSSGESDADADADEEYDDYDESASHNHNHTPFGKLQTQGSTPRQTQRQSSIVSLASRSSSMSSLSSSSIFSSIKKIASSKDKLKTINKSKQPAVPNRATKLDPNAYEVDYDEEYTYAGPTGISDVAITQKMKNKFKFGRKKGKSSSKVPQRHGVNEEEEDGYLSETSVSDMSEFEYIGAINRSWDHITPVNDVFSNSHAVKL